MSESNSDDGATPTPFFARPRTWLLLLAGALTVYLYYPLFFPPSYQTIALQSEEFFFEANEAAGLPVLVLAAWLFYRRIHFIDLFRTGGEPFLGGALLTASAGLYAWGHYTDASDLQLATVIPLLFGAAIAIGGRAAARAYWVPIVFLGFALPLPPVLLSAAIFPVQLVTAEYAGTILNLIGVKSLVQGDQILRPENTFIVIETCSGVRTVVTLTMLTVLLIDLFERRGLHAAILLVSAPLVAFVTNGFRVVSLVLNPHSSVASIHNLQGIIMLLIGLTALYLLDLGLEKLLGSQDPAAREDDYGAVANAAPRRGGPLGAALVLATTLAMLATSSVVTPYAPQGGLEETPEALLERVFSDSPGRTIPPDYEFRGSIRYLAHHDRALRFEGEPLEVFLGIANERLRTHTILSARLAWPRSGWVPVEDERVELPGSGLDVRRVLLERGGRRMLSYSAYLREGSLLGESLRQAAALDRSPFERDEHILAVRVSAPVARGANRMQEAEERIRRAWARLLPELEGFAPMRAGS